MWEDGGREESGICLTPYVVRVISNKDFIYIAHIIQELQLNVLYLKSIQTIIIKTIIQVIEVIQINKCNNKIQPQSLRNQKYI